MWHERRIPRAFIIIADDDERRTLSRKAFRLSLSRALIGRDADKSRAVRA